MEGKQQVGGAMERFREWQVAEGNMSSVDSKKPR
jgi:hypothetical protein